jgi:hypothetical protein
VPLIFVLSGTSLGSPTVHKTVIANQPNQGTFERFMTCLWPKLNRLQRRILMGATTDKIKGTANEAIGKAKQGLGEATGSDRLPGRRRDPGAEGQGPEGRWRCQGRPPKDAVNKAAAAANKNL